MLCDHPVQLSLIPRALGELRAEQRLVGLWLGGERWLSRGDHFVAAFVFFHLRDGGEAVVSVRSEEARIPSKAHGRWWVEGPELVVALGHGHIRGRFHVEGNVLTWCDEVLMRRSVAHRDVHAEQPAALDSVTAAATAASPTPDPTTDSAVPTAPAAPRHSVRLQFELD